MRERTRYRTPAERQLTQQRSERTRRANSIKGLIVWITGHGDRKPLPDPALPFWRDDVLVKDVRKLAHIVREWGWLDGEPAYAGALKRADDGST